MAPLCLIFSLIDLLGECRRATPQSPQGDKDWEADRDWRRSKDDRKFLEVVEERAKEKYRGLINRGQNICSSCSPVLSVAPHSWEVCGICFEVRACASTSVLHFFSYGAFAPLARGYVCSCALSLMRKKRPLIEFPLISRQPRLAERDACLPAAQRHTSGVVDNGGWHFCPTMPRGSMWYMASSMKVKLS